MIKENIDKSSLVRKLNQKLVLVEMESKLLSISCSLLEDEIYTIENATEDLIEIIELIELEQQAVMSEIRVLNR